MKDTNKPNSIGKWLLPALQEESHTGAHKDILTVFLSHSPNVLNAAFNPILQKSVGTDSLYKKAQGEDWSDYEKIKLEEIPTSQVVSVLDNIFNDRMLSTADIYSIESVLENDTCFNAIDASLSKYITLLQKADKWHNMLCSDLTPENSNIILTALKVRVKEYANVIPLAEAVSGERWIQNGKRHITVRGVTYISYNDEIRVLSTPRYIKDVFDENSKYIFQENNNRYNVIDVSTGAVSKDSFALLKAERTIQYGDIEHVWDWLVKVGDVMYDIWAKYWVRDFNKTNKDIAECRDDTFFSVSDNIIGISWRMVWLDHFYKVIDGKLYVHVRDVEKSRVKFRDKEFIEEELITTAKRAWLRKKTTIKVKGRIDFDNKPFVPVNPLEYYYPSTS